MCSDKDNMLECKICGCLFPATIEKHYVSREETKTGLSTVYENNEVKEYDTFDCPKCGCQNIVQERKREVKKKENGKA